MLKTADTMTLYSHYYATVMVFYYATIKIFTSRPTNYKLYIKNSTYTINILVNKVYG